MSVEVGKKSRLENFINWVERVGNKLPHPFWIFVILAFFTMFLSYLLAGISVTYLAARAGEAPTEARAAVVNLFSHDSIRALLSGFTRTYVNFAPLGLVLTMMLGIGIVEQAGMISALMRKTVLGAPRWLVTTAIAFVGISANLASDAGIIFTPVIAAAVFKALGRNPWVGIAVGYAAASGGFTANIFVAGTDVLLGGITESAVRGAAHIPAHVMVNPLMNWFYMAAAAVVLTILTVYVTEKYTIKLLGDTEGIVDPEELKKHAVTPAENRGLLYSFLALILYFGVIALLTYPEGSLFRATDGSIISTTAGVRSPILDSIMPILFLMFFFLGSAYGYGAGVIQKGEDIPKLMAKGVTGSVGFMVVVLPAALFIEIFRMSRFDVIMSVRGAEMLKALQLDNFPLLVLLLFIVFVMFLNLFMMSGSAKWLILAPIFVPMFAHIGISPAFSQLAFRIGDSPTNIITPLSPYLPVVIGLLEQYKKEGAPKVGIGTVISMGLPYTIYYIFGFIGLMIVWYFAGWAIGPGAAMMIG